MARIYDAIVVGTGLGGMIAALSLAQKGLKTIILAKGAGAVAISSGCVDVLGYANGQLIRENPFNFMGSLPAEHPYSLIGSNEVHEALNFFTARCQAHNHLLMSEKSKNIFAYTAAGTFKPTYLCPPANNANKMLNAPAINIVGFEGMRDCNAILLATSLGQRERFKGCEIRAHVLPQPNINARRNPGPLDVARYIDTEEGLQWLIDKLAPIAAAEAVLVLPPILGVMRHDLCWQAASSLPGGIVEMLALPPGVGGMRLNHTLQRALRLAGVQILENVDVSGAQIDKKHCLSVSTKGPDKERYYRAKAFVIATGGFLGGGHTAVPGKATENIFGIDLATPKEQSLWSEPDIFSEHAYAKFGIKTDERMAPLGANGNIILENVFFAGRALAGYDFAIEKSGHGVAIATGFRAARSAIELCSE